MVDLSGVTLPQPKLTKYIPHTPFVQQHAFLLLDDVREILYGGAAGGGKSDALLMAALQYVDVPGYRALLLRRSYKDLSLPGALMDRAHQWLTKTDARWNANDKTWTFPTWITDHSGKRVHGEPSTITFGYLDTETDKYQYQGAEFQFVGFDELTQFLESQYLYLFSRLRRLKDSPIPVRMRAGSNPGGIGHNWVHKRFVTNNKNPRRLFISSKLDDNPHLDRKEYRSSLAELPRLERQQLELGDWNAKAEGGLFQRAWFANVVPASEAIVALRVRAWDLAATPGGGDWTVGVRMAVSLDYRKVWIEHVVRGQWGSGERDIIIKRTAKFDSLVDGTPTIQLLEQQPGEAGVSEVAHFAALLGAFPVEFVKPTGSKYVRSMPYQSAGRNGRILVVEGRWVDDFVDEHVVWQGSQTKGEVDDQVDAASHAYAKLYPEGAGPGTIALGSPRVHQPRSVFRSLRRAVLGRRRMI